MRWINARPNRGMQLFLLLLPFAILIALYAMGSAVRLADNANDKLLPGLSSFAAAIDRMALVPDQRTGEYLMWMDTKASLARLLVGVGISTALALVTGCLLYTSPSPRD